MKEDLKEEIEMLNDQRGRCVVLLMTHWGFTPKQVADLFGVTPRIVTLWFNKMRKKVSK